MVTHVTAAAIRQLSYNFVSPSAKDAMVITPSTRNASRMGAVSDQMGELVCKRSRLSSPISPHEIANLRVGDGVEESDSNYKVVESSDSCSDDDSFTENTVLPDSNMLDFNLLISKKDFATFVTQNFSCKQCNSPVKEQNIVTV